LRLMNQSIAHVALVVKDYDESIAFFTKKLNFTLIEDTYQPEQDKRWVVVSPPGSSRTSLLLARASTSEQETFIGRQSGGRVFLFLATDDFWRDYNDMIAKDIHFVQRVVRCVVVVEIMSTVLCKSEYRHACLSHWT